MNESVIDLGFACLDLDREKRCGHPEVIFGEGKSPGDFSAIVEALYHRLGYVLATRCHHGHFAEVRKCLPEAIYHEKAQCVTIGKEPEFKNSLLTGIVCAGTSDLPVAEECAISLRSFGQKTQMFTDVGVAGIHRLFRALDDIRRCAVVIVIAGMEGALPSVVAGLVDSPVIAVPTSVGYGSSFQGLSALLGMLNSCAAGLVVTNIDNGFGAAVAAHRILSQATK